MTAIKQLFQNATPRIRNSGIEGSGSRYDLVHTAYTVRHRSKDFNDVFLSIEAVQDQTAKAVNIKQNTLMTRMEQAWLQ